MPYADSSKQKEYMKTYTQSRKSVLNSLKEGRPCTDCGGVFHPAAMQFDHLPNNVKFRNLSRMATYKWERILEEVSKCELVCANCHAVRTATRVRVV